jgi:hypothetical protein
MKQKMELLKKKMPFKGSKMTEEHKKKISEAHKGKKFSAEHLKRLSEVRKGKPHSKELCRKISEGHRNKPLSEYHKRRISESHIGLVPNEYHRKRVSEGLKKSELFQVVGVTKIAISLSGRHLSEEHKRKISRALKGKKQNHKEQFMLSDREKLRKAEIAKYKKIRKDYLEERHKIELKRIEVIEKRKNARLESVKKKLDAEESHYNDLLKRADARAEGKRAKEIRALEGKEDRLDVLSKQIQEEIAMYKKTPKELMSLDEVFHRIEKEGSIESSKGYSPKAIFVNNGKENRRVKFEELREYEGWNIGKLKTK